MSTFSITPQVCTVNKNIRFAICIITLVNVKNVIGTSGGNQIL